ncbi:MAG: hypothetical protein AAFP85_05025 [Pseudomonadota bacterium]
MRAIFSAILVVLFCVGRAAADAPEPIDLSPINHAAAELVIAGQDGTERRFTPAMLEELDTFRMRTTTPWREEPANFDGVLLSDLLRASGLDDVDEIRVTAENDYTTVIPRALWETIPVLIATRVDGQPHTRRERGPIQFVISMDDYTASSIASEAHMVWMAARIEAQ